MALSFLYLAVRARLGALVRARRGLDVKDMELLVLRHESVAGDPGVGASVCAREPALGTSSDLR
jgi:hypothetical protein